MLAEVPDHLGHFGRRRLGSLGGPQGSRLGRSFLVGNDFPVILDGKLAIGMFQHSHLDAGIAGPVLGRQQLQGAQLVLDGVVPGHLAGVLEAEDPFRMQRGVQGTIGGLGLLGRDDKLVVEAG